MVTTRLQTSEKDGLVAGVVFSPWDDDLGGIQGLNSQLPSREDASSAQVGLDRQLLQKLTLPRLGCVTEDTIAPSTSYWGPQVI